MPTLIRLIVALLFLGGVGFAGMYALTIFVNPGNKLVTVRVPQSQMALTPVTTLPPQPQVTEAAVLPQQDDAGTKEVDSSNE